MSADDDIAARGRKLAASGKYAPPREIAKAMRGTASAADIKRAIEALDTEEAMRESGDRCPDCGGALGWRDGVRKCWPCARSAGGDSVTVTTSDELLDGAELLDDIKEWFGRFIAVTDPDDLNILSLWTAHTHLVIELYTTPRLQIDSVIFGSGKTTVLDHLQRLCLNPIQAAWVSSPALIPRMLEIDVRTLLLDEIDRSLRSDKPGVEDIFAILNSGYRSGATRPVLVPAKGGGWEMKDMSTYAPIAMAGNSPNLPADTVSRSLRILLMPDLNGTVEDSDWEMIADDAERLRSKIAAWADTVRAQVKGMVVDLPDNCIGRSKEKWRPLKRVAVAAGWDFRQGELSRKPSYRLVRTVAYTIESEAATYRLCRAPVARFPHPFKTQRESLVTAHAL